MIEKAPMNDESKTPSNDYDPGMSLATPEILNRWLDFETMTLWDAALIAHGASPDAGGIGLSERSKRAVEETCEVLSRVVKLKPGKGEGIEALYATAEIFEVLVRKGHEFPAMVKAALLERHLIPSGTRRIRSQPHGNTVLNEDKRVQMMRAMICVLANPDLHPSCRDRGAVDGEVVGTDLARTIMANQKDLFVGGKATQVPGTIAKLFNDIVRPQVP